MKNYKLKLFIICLLGILTILSFIACKDPQTKIDRDKLVKANALDVIMENHTSIKETVKYYENLNNKFSIYSGGLLVFLHKNIP